MSYTPNLGHFRTFSCQVYAKIPDKRWVKSKKTTPVRGRKRYIRGYTSESIYQVYFSNSRQIKTIQDLDFDESYDNKEIKITIVEEPFFSFLKLELFTDNTFNAFVRDKELPVPLIFHPAEDNSDLFLAHSLDNNSLPIP